MQRLFTSLSFDKSLLKFNEIQISKRISKRKILKELVDYFSVFSSQNKNVVTLHIKEPRKLRNCILCLKSLLINFFISYAFFIDVYKMCAYVCMHACMYSKYHICFINDVPFTFNFPYVFLTLFYSDVYIEHQN